MALFSEGTLPPPEVSRGPATGKGLNKREMTLSKRDIVQIEQLLDFTFKNGISFIVSVPCGGNGLQHTALTDENRTGAALGQPGRTFRGKYFRQNSQMKSCLASPMYASG